MALVRLLVIALALTPQVFLWKSESPFLLTKALYLHLTGAFACLALVLAGFRHPTAAGLPRGLLVLALFVGYAAARAPWFAETRPEIAAPFLWDALLLVAWPTVALARNTAGGVRRHALLVILLGGLTAAYALLQVLGVGVVSPHQAGRVVAASFTPGAGHPPYATLGNPNFLAEYLAALLPLAMAGAAFGSGAARWLAGTAAALAAMALPLTLDRGAWLGALLGLAVTFLFRPKGQPLGRRFLLSACLFAAAALLAAVAMERWSPGTSPLKKLVAGWTQITTESGGRRLWWSATLRMVADHPLAGVGEGRFQEVYPAYQARVLASLPNPDGMAVASASVESPHNDYLQVAADLGIPGFVLLGGALLLLLWDGAATAREAQGTERAWRAGCLGGLVAILIAGLLGYPLHTASGLYMTATLAALAVAPSPRASTPVRAPRWQGWLLAALTGLGLWQTARLLTIYAASLHLHRGSEAILRRDLQAAIDAFARAHEVRPRDSQVRMALGRAYLLGHRPDLALPHLQAGLHGFDGAHLRTLLGNAHALLGEDQAAEEMFRTGAAWFPGGYPHLYVSYGSFLAARGRDAEAARQLVRALAINPNLAEAHYLLGQVRAGSGDPAGAALAWQRFLDLAPPGDPRVEPAKTFLRQLEGRAAPH